MPRDTTPHQIPDKIKRALRREFTSFFTHMRTPEPGWPAVPDHVMVDALADSLVEIAERDKKAGIAYLQTLVHELQDRINSKTQQG